MSIKTAFVYFSSTTEGCSETPNPLLFHTKSWKPQPQTVLTKADNSLAANARKFSTNRALWRDTAMSTVVSCVTVSHICIKLCKISSFLNIVKNFNVPFSKSKGRKFLAMNNTPFAYTDSAKHSIQHCTIPEVGFTLFIIQYCGHRLTCCLLTVKRQAVMHTDHW